MGSYRYPPHTTDTPTHTMTTPHAHSPTPPVLYTFPSPDEVSKSLAEFVINAQNKAVAKRDKFKLAISGGSLAATLAKHLVGNDRVKWDKWEVFFANERLVPLDHDDSNFKLNNDVLFSKVPIPRENIHTCSLFPGHELLKEELRWIAYLEDSPKPPAKRITLTYPVLSHAYRAAFVITGDGKKEILKQALDGHTPPLPASLVRPVAPGEVFWFTDEAAASQTNYGKSQFHL